MLGQFLRNSQRENTMFPEPDSIGKYFHELFKGVPDQQKKKSEWKKTKKGKPQKGKDKKKTKVEALGDVSSPPEVELPGNASSFAVFATVRMAVLECWMKEACEIYLQSSGSSPATYVAADSDTDDDEGDVDKELNAPARIPKIVGVGLRSVFELIRESRHTYPELCTRALSALLDVIQGQQPEGLKAEPAEVIEPLFKLLLELATSSGEPPTSHNDGSNLTAVACACLLSLVVVRGETGKLLAATAALLMSPRILATQNIVLPVAVAALQRSVHGVLLGKVVRPDWITHGVPKTAKLSSFKLKLPGDGQGGNKAMASDGQYLYVHSSRGLFKFGSGYSGTIRGHVYQYKSDFYNDKRGWLGFAQGQLYYRSLDKGELVTIDTTSLTVQQVVRIEVDGMMFSDGDQLGIVTATRDDGFVVRTLNPGGSPIYSVSELPLKLARKCLDVFGTASYDEESNIHSLNTGYDDEVSSIYGAREFCLLRTTSGKILYCGKPSALGLKQGGNAGSRWQELIVAKAPRIAQVAAGHEGLHAVLVGDDGSVYFTGTARRGEDGDLNKPRRQLKAVKPKKITKIEPSFVVAAACNIGTTGLVTKEGELYMYGKDNTHCDINTGLVKDLKEVHVAQVALGKAHAVALTNKGCVYTFGINNKGQCGREFVSQVKEATVVAMETTVEEEGGEEEEGEWEDTQEVMCAPGQHKWKHDLCMVCTVCRECTGYSISCLSSMRPDRNPGQECGCGEGDSGCAECGCCRICAKENVDNSELAILGPSGAGDIAGMMRLDLIFGGRHGARLQDHLQRRLEERKLRQRGKLGSKHNGLKLKGANNRPGPSIQPPPAVTKPPIPFRTPVPATAPALVVEEVPGGSDVEKETTRVTSLPPGQLHLPNDIPVVQIACGLHHTLLLTQNGEVYSFGSNSYGQLGVGDIMIRGGPVLVKLPGMATGIAAGSNHSVVLMANGQVYTFGNYQKGQLGRPAPDGSMVAQGRKERRPDAAGWYATPGLVAGVGPRHGRRATWVAAAGDQTFMRIDESLINSFTLQQSSLMANKNCIVLLPTQCELSKTFKCLVINKRDGNCNSFQGSDQVDFTQTATCLDPLYNILWCYSDSGDSPEINSYNVVCCENRLEVEECILRPQLSLPWTPGCQVTRYQAALHLLGVLDTLTQAQEKRLTVRAHTDQTETQDKVFIWDDFCTVNRFESHGGGWGYSGHSVEAIRFMADTDILLAGFGLFGGRGEYTGKIKLYDIGVDGGEQESDGEVIAEIEEVPYECGPRQKYPMLFDDPIPLQANRWYVAWARVSGPSSDCGSSGQGMVSTEDQVVFYFKSSKKSNNGTDVNAGQIPQLLYRVVTPENQTATRQTDTCEPVYILSKEFSRAVSTECFRSLLSLLQWSWAAFKAGLTQSAVVTVASSSTASHLTALLDLERLVYVCRACLRLLKTYINEIYPNQVSHKKVTQESIRLAECVGDVRALLRTILSDSLPSLRRKNQGSQYSKMSLEVLEECHQTFVACFHAFYPTAFLKWTALCDLLASMDKKGDLDRLVSAVVAALCSPTVRLRSTFPISTSPDGDGHNLLRKQLSPSDNSGLPMMPGMDTHHYPILVEQMSYRSQVEVASVWQFKDVLDHLLDIVTLSIKQALRLEKVTHSSQLVTNSCHLLAKVVAELAAQARGIDEDLEGACGRVMHATPSRFMRTNQTRTWNTGNGSPDAICFTVDRGGVVVAGVGVYGGAGTYDYELELLDDVSNTNNDASHGQRWNSLQLTRGSFGPDDCQADDIVELMFDYPVYIKENVKYAIRLRNHGGRTSNGDGGVSSVKGPDGVTFTFSTCSLNFNGTTPTRGQIPYILYFSNPQDSEGQASSKAMVEAQARRSTLTLAGAIVSRSAELLALARERAEEVTASDVLGSACLVTTLLPLMLAHISPLATSDPRSGVQVLSLIQELLPHVSALNLLSCGMGQSVCSVESISCPDNNHTTTSHHYVWVESDHPYKPATISNYRVVFPECVKWVCVEFSPECGTAQAEDSLQLYIPATNTASATAASTIAPTVPAEDSVPYYPVLHRFSNIPSQWPQSAVVLPGNEVIFSLETASDYMKDEKASFYGFKCLVVGYEGNQVSSDGLRHLETELSFLGGMCAASLMRRDLVLPVSSVDEIDEEVEAVEEIAQQVYTKHASLLGKGFALASAPTINQALEGVLPFSCHCNERLFLRDLVVCTPGTSGGRLARWLQPESHVDPARCQLLYPRDEMRCGWPAVVNLTTKDQYGQVVHVPYLKIEVKAVPIDKKEAGDSRKVRRVSQPDELTFGGHAQPSLDTPYEATVRDQMCYNAITMMKVYENYSFEELRYTSPAVKRTSETMLVRPNSDGTYSATWTPGSVGWYCIHATIDGYTMEEVHKVEVKDPPQGIMPPTQSHTPRKATHQPNRLRKFVARNSAGLRVRAHPSLQSEQIGVVHVNGTIAFVDEIHNDDGVWLRLTQDTIRQYCHNSYPEAWCLQYNQHLGKTLLLPLQEPKTVLDHVVRESRGKPTTSHEIPKVLEATSYKVVKCGASGHNVRSSPSLTAPPIGMLHFGNHITVTCHSINKEGTWVQLDKDTISNCCFNLEEEAWSLATDKNNFVYLRPDKIEKDSEAGPSSSPDVFSPSLSKASQRGFDFSGPDNPTVFPVFTPPSSSVNNSNPFVFGSSVPALPVKDETKTSLKDSSIKSSGPKWFKPAEEPKPPTSKVSYSRDMPPELAGVSVKDLVKAIGESRANGNGVTPPDTPRRLSRSSSPLVSRDSRSSSPVPIPAFPGKHRTQGGRPLGGVFLDSPSSSPQACGSPRSIGISPLVSGAMQDSMSQRRGSTQSDTSALVSSLTRDLTPSPSGSSLHSAKSVTTPETPRKAQQESDSSSRSMAQAGTQTSPEAVKGHFSIGTGGPKDESRLSPKMGRKDRPSRSIKRAMSPQQQRPPQQEVREPVKEAMSPSVAESLRATFAAFLWHEGIVHDAMACASFLKFHPTLPKQGAMVVTRHTDRARPTMTRHSVEVSTAGSYLHIQPSTLETLTRSAANANASRHRGRGKTGVIQEETTPATAPPQLQTVTVLPPALRCLVFLWEELTSSCLQTFATNAYLPSPSQSAGPVLPKVGGRGKVVGGEAGAAEGEGKLKARKKKEWKGMVVVDMSVPADRGTVHKAPCELCGGVYPQPITYHMRQAHPGCGRHAGGKGYNSRGNFCVGWAGNCGDGGVGGSSWYLVCESCRDKYLQGKKQSSAKKTSRKKTTIVAPSTTKASSPASDIPAIATSQGYLETHVVMKNNAMFLLELSSGADPQPLNPSPPESGGPFPPPGPLQCLHALGVPPSTLVDDCHFLHDERETGRGGRRDIDPTATYSLVSDSMTSDSDSDSSKGRLFHRSVSMGTSGAPWSRREGDGRVIMMRKRNNSTCDAVNEPVSSLLCVPSAALQRLVPTLCQSAIVSVEKPGIDILGRPVLQFLLQQHNLPCLQAAMRRALHKATCRVYAMQALNWLLRSVTQSTCLHDLLWWLVAALSPAIVEPEPPTSGADPKPDKKEDHDVPGICEHPLSDMSLVGESVQPLASTFHALLQTVADLMLMLPMGSALQQMAVRCWGIRFTQADHMFLHRSHVFSNISKILSRSEEEQDDTSLSMQESHHSTYSQMHSFVEILKDLTPGMEVKASSRQAMVGSLTDNSTETFWESGDEDRNKTKTITLTSPPRSSLHLVYIHIDNCRDLANKVSSVTFQTGPNIEELYKIRTIEVESRATGWFSCTVVDREHSVVRLELKGPDNSLRLRQIRVLGEMEGEPLKQGRQHSALTIQQRNTEAETLKVFRLITSQVFGQLFTREEDSAVQKTNGSNVNMVFGKLITGEQEEPTVEETNDLKEHMVGILFSRSKLTHLQKQVCTHIVQAIRKETAALREDWETRLCSGTQANDAPDTYCFEMLSMVLALSGSSVGRSYLALQQTLLTDLLSLLHTGSARVQRQVTLLLRRMLPEVAPQTLAHLTSVPRLPPTDFSAATSTKSSDAEFDPHRVGILDVFLSVIAKALTVQVKVKAKEGKGVTSVTLATAIHPRDQVGKRWWLRGCISRKLAEDIIQLIKDMSAGKLSEMWARVTKGAIAENIMNLTKLSEVQRGSAECARCPTLWLALASLCVLDNDHVERLSSAQWRNAADGNPPPPRPTCNNHDDGETLAIIQCNVCGSLCADCDRFLHLHRRMRMHHRQVCKEEEEAIRVDLHEGCGRTKLFWALLLADSCTLKAMVEFREGTRPNSKAPGVVSGVCRFCGATGSSGLLEIGNICADQECQDHAHNACTKMHVCGHLCSGISGETECLPCLHGCSGDLTLKQDADDMCMICFTEALSCAPAIQLKCGHVFHLHCCRNVLSKRWAGPRITFAFSQCPICKAPMEHPVLGELLAPILSLLEDVRRKAVMRLEYEGLDKGRADPASYAMDRYAYYVCFKCNKAYYGGEARCDAELGSGDFDPAELVCGACSDVSRAQMCPKHGTDFLEYKCRYCCSVAVFFCFGTTHFCNACHDDFQRVTNIHRDELPTCPAGPRAKQLDGDECPLHVKHPPTGEEFALGCGVCRNAHTF
ncbi:E3 ubiquitin-protein ligase MYCBP2 isoform X4 [Homalodisca vitripennis]|uniref:E3 ubiquitin-protein ligase MYCBP2 isoform X4 n=1 Tax=Homalodisca vitripennis TaxID=197043 RepID=UPI001EEAE0A3|nr:E3 ubiquitin-protein ligase MYCBP2 isoform X4 [Homalodisca vitripennis]